MTTTEAKLERILGPNFGPNRPTLTAEQGEARAAELVGIAHFDRAVEAERQEHASSSGRDWRPGSVIYTGPVEANLRVVDVLEEEDDDPERFEVLVVEPA